jgi:hypothetical protein
VRAFQLVAWQSRLELRDVPVPEPGARADSCESWGRGCLSLDLHLMNRPAPNRIGLARRKDAARNDSAFVISPGAELAPAPDRSAAHPKFARGSMLGLRYEPRDGLRHRRRPLPTGRDGPRRVQRHRPHP